MEYNKPRYNPKIHHRRSIRLKGYDYSQAGLYFITVCCQDRICRFGEIRMGRNGNVEMGRPQGYAPTDNATMILNDAGKMVDAEWLALVDRFPNIALHEYIVMPNHFHCILEIVSNNTHVDGANIVGMQIGRNVGACPCGRPNNIETGRNGIVETGRNGIVETGRNGIVETGRPQGYAPTGTQNDDGVPKNKTIGDMMDAFKSITTVKYIDGVKNRGWDQFDGKIWQRNYFEHIIRNEQSYQRIADYIKNNPGKWEDDKFYTP